MKTILIGCLVMVSGCTEKAAKALPNPPPVTSPTGAPTDGGIIDGLPIPTDATLRPDAGIPLSDGVQ